MQIKREKLVFTNAAGEQLAGLLESPPAPQATALFAHCFTCSKDVSAASRISRALAALGIAVLRFDFTGLGNSEGDFANTNFSSNVSDLLAAARHLHQTRGGPQLMIGHSLGGAAVLAAAAEVTDCKAVITIGAPGDPAHVSHLFDHARAELEDTGAAEVTLGGRRFTIKRQLLEDLAQQRLEERIRNLGRALLVMHSPVDEIVDVDHARRIYTAALHPKSYVSLDDADHLLSRRADSEYVARVISAWASRYLPAPAAADPPESPRLDTGEVLVRELEGLTQEVYSGRHRLFADEPADLGGADRGPSPYEYLLAGLGACTSMTLRMYARRKSIALEGVSVRLRHDKIHASDCEECETREGRIDRIEREIDLRGDLDAGQRASLLAIADRCPVHRTLHSEISIVTREAGG